MSFNIKGIHHITAIAGDPQTNLDFYASVLGLRMIKKTVNFDAPDTYHFYYGDKTGSPGTVLTFFPWGRGAWKGHSGTGQVSAIAFAIPAGSMNYWVERLQEIDIALQEPFIRFDEEILTFRDPDGIQLELVASSVPITETIPWNGGPVPVEHAITGFHSAALAVEDHLPSLELLTNQLGFEFDQQNGSRYRLKNKETLVGGIADLQVFPPGNRGKIGVGTVHHIAWRVANDEAQLKKREQLIQQGYEVTPVMDRHYFHSVYFREPGDILYEIATDNPGFLVDETIAELGSHLKLPGWYETRRREIEAVLPRVKKSGTIRKIFQE
jgi:catechol 2,3-dioxygenase-like lactoylglutathione lyase family enzyme